MSIAIGCDDAAVNLKYVLCRTKQTLEIIIIKFK